VFKGPISKGEEGEEWGEEVEGGIWPTQKFWHGGPCANMMMFVEC